MKVRRSICSFALIVFTISCSFVCASNAQIAKRPVAFRDVNSWRQIENATVSNNGNWFAYHLVSPDGTAALIVRHTGDDLELTLPVSDLSSGPASFSDDSQWLVYFTRTLKPKQQESDEEPDPNLVLLNLDSQRKAEFDNVQRFRFAGKWLALQVRVARSTASGSDLLLRNLGTSSEIRLHDVGEFAFSSNAMSLVWATLAPNKNENDVRLMYLESGKEISLDSGAFTYKQLNWHKSDSLTFLRGAPSDTTSYSIVAFSNIPDGSPSKTILDPSSTVGLGRNIIINDHFKADWADSLNAITYYGYERSADQSANRNGSAPATRSYSNAKDLVLWHWRNKNLRSESPDAGKASPVTYKWIFWLDERRAIRIVDESLMRVVNIPKREEVIGLDSTNYDVSNNYWHSYQDIWLISLRNGHRTQLVIGAETFYQSPGVQLSPKGENLVFFRKGNFFLLNIASHQIDNLTAGIGTSFVDNELPSRPPYTRPDATLWSRDGTAFLLSDAWDVWKISIKGQNAVNLTNNGRLRKIRYNFLRQGDAFADTEPLYLTFLEEKTKKRGLAKFVASKISTLLVDDADLSEHPSFTLQRIIKAKHAEKFIFPKQTYKDFPDYFVIDVSTKRVRRLTEANPQANAYQWPAGYRVVEYKGATGASLCGALLLPADYDPSKRYPTIVYVYERIASQVNKFPQSLAIAFSPSLYASQGYAVLMPDISYRMADPGGSAVLSVSAALKAAIGTGVVDPSRVGIYGHSFGGYETAFIVTQTHIFKAAVAGAPMTDLISMYDSLRSNTGVSQQGYFESNQGRIGILWNNLTAYQRNSPVYYANKVTTPLLIWHNDMDDAVPWSQSVEYFNALRRLQKPVIMLQYKGESHTLSKQTNIEDCSTRIKEFFDHYLLNKPAPEWMSGVLR